MKKSILSLLVATIFIFSACQSDVSPVVSIESMQGEVQATDIPEKMEQTITPFSEPTPTQEPSPTEISEETTEPTEKPTAAPTAKPMEKPTASPTSKPTNQPTPGPTVMPTPTDQPTEEPEIEITAVSSSYINAAMAEINRLRKDNGVAPAVYNSSMSSSCQSHAVSMAESGTAFHASGGYVFEAVGRASRYMSGTTMKLLYPRLIW